MATPKKEESMKKKQWITYVIFAIGFILCISPVIFNLFGHHRQKDVITTFDKKIQEQSEDKLRIYRKNAQEYNSMLFQCQGAVVDESDKGILSDKSYKKQLDVTGTGVIGSISIPKINVNLPIYHGTEDDVLSNSAGHLTGTSLPVGGENTHCVITGHRGLPSSKLFVRLDELKKGDLFFLNVLDETLAYKVDEIKVVEPDNVNLLEIQPGKDLVSLVTCTPYGINTHRLIVTGNRVDYEIKQQQNIKRKFPSFRECLFTVLPFVLLATMILLRIKNGKEIDYENAKI